MTKYNSNRLNSLFSKLESINASGLGIFITAGDPDFATSLEIMKGLPEAGADMIEFGMPFSDPMADGPAIQASSKRALESGASLKKTLEMVKLFRKDDSSTPIILMGYYNPIYSFGVCNFLEEAIEAGADGLIVVDLPPEEDNELCIPAQRCNLPFIRLTAPTTTTKRLKTVLQNASGFIYYVSITGITGTKDVPVDLVTRAVKNLKEKSKLPIAVGFGIKTRKHVEQITNVADAAIIGSEVVNTISNSLDADGKAQPKTVQTTLSLVRKLASGVRGKQNL